MLMQVFELLMDEIKFYAEFSMKYPEMSLDFFFQNSVEIFTWCYPY